MRMADRIALMRAGALVQVGTPRELYSEPVDLMAARFFSELNEIPGVVGAGAVSTPLGAFPVPAGLTPGAEVDVGVRPQGVICAAPSAPGAAGRILKRRFLGEVDLLEIAVEGLDVPLQARLRGGAELKVGTDVSVTLAPADVLIFPKTP
jgi:iron(III) transport system ATP-binding protein